MMREMRAVQESGAGLYGKLADSIGNPDRVQCVTCGRIEKVDAAECFKRGWPTCHGATMGLKALQGKRERMSTDSKRAHCEGCRNNFYNGGNNPHGIQECWSLKDAKVVTRWRIGWWVPMDRASNFRKVRTLNCWHAPGQYALMDELPAHLRGQRAHESENP